MAIGRVPGETGIQPSIVTAKGDLIVATANGSVTNQAVGTNNQVLMADSAQGDGVKWANEATATLTTTGDMLYASAANTLARRAIGSTGDVLTVSGGLPTWAAPSAVPPAVIMQVSGNYITNPYTATANNTATLNQTYYYPVYLNGIAFDRITVRTSSGHTGTSSVRLGLYNLSTTTGKPTTVVFDAGTVSCTASSTTYEITISQTPAAGLYCLAFNVQSASGTAQFAGQTSATNILTAQNKSIGAAGNVIAWTQTGVTGAFATAGTVSPLTNDAPSVFLRMA